MENKQYDDLIIIKLQNEYDDRSNDNNVIDINLSSNTIQLSFFFLFKYSQLVQEECFKNEFIRFLSSRFQEIQDQYKIKEESIIIFLKLLQEEQVEITNDKYCDLYKLSDIFKVKSLHQSLKNYAKQNSENIDFLINLLINFESKQYEIEFMKDIISEDIENYLMANINECLQNENFGQLQISTIYRIIEKCKKQKFSSDLLFEFIIISVEKNFILFKFLDLESLSQNNFDYLYDNYYMNESKANMYHEYLPTSLNYIKKLRENELNLLERLKKLEENLNESNTQQNLLKKEMDEFLNQIKSRLEDEEKFKAQINDLKNENEKTQKLVKKLNDEKQEMNSQINNLTKENKQLHEKIKNLNEEKQKTKNDDQINQEKNENITNISDQIQDGIIQYFDQKNSQMPDKKLIQIFIMDGFCNYRKSFNNIGSCVSSPNKFQYYELVKNDVWAIFDFKENLVEISSYSIKSSNYDKNCTHIKSWSVDVSNDGRNWVTIDVHSNFTELNGPGITKTFNVLTKKFSRYARLMNRGDCYGKHNGWVPEISYIEFYGQIKNTNNK